MFKLKDVIMRRILSVLIVVLFFTVGYAATNSEELNEIIKSGCNYIYLQSDPNDFIGGGRTYTYTPANAKISLRPVKSNNGYFSIDIKGDENWKGDFQGMNHLNQLQPGYYGDLQRYPFHNPVKGGLSWSGESRGCNKLTGWFVVDNVTYEKEILTAIDLRFEQHCEGASPALHGQIHWKSNDNSPLPRPLNPPPAGLWEFKDATSSSRPVISHDKAKPSTGAAQAVSETGLSDKNAKLFQAAQDDNLYIYLQSDPNDFIGGGRTYTYTPANAKISLRPVKSNNGYFSIDIKGDENWTGEFKIMNNFNQLQPGYYGNLKRYPFHNPVKGGLDWRGERRSCNKLNGWFVIDNVLYEKEILTAIDLRFEQHCEGASPALHGQIHWKSNNTTPLPVPVISYDKAKPSTGAAQAVSKTGLSDKNAKLFQAAQDGNFKDVQTAMAEGADINAISANTHDLTALMAASGNGHTEVVKLLLNKGADVNIKGSKASATALLYASIGGHEEIIKLLLNKGADVNAQLTQKSGGMNALMWASTAAHYETVKLLLDNGADINVKNIMGGTALMMAVSNVSKNAIDVVKLLLDRGADVNVKDIYGNTVMMKALESNNTKIAKLFLDKGANFNEKSNDGSTALITAAFYGRTEAIKFLLDNGADVNIRSNDGSTALIKASSCGHTSYNTIVNEHIFASPGVCIGNVKLLLDKGANVNVQSNDGSSALKIAGKYGKIEIVEMLKKAGAKE